jgi:hypothetical protein
MKRNSNSRNFAPAKYESYDMTDTRYYGMFIKRHGKESHVLIDPKRYQKIFDISEKMKIVMDKREGPFFKPAKKHILDYNVNSMLDDFQKIYRQWEKINKPTINRILKEISGKTYNPYDDDLAMSGILDATEAAINANMKTRISHLLAEEERNTVYYSFYAQFFHQMVSQIEALFLKALTRNGYEGDKINRNILYAFKGSNQEKVSKLEGFKKFDMMYNIWNCIKHNSLSTFNTLRENFPEIIRYNDFTQGEIACFYINFNDSLIDAIFSGVDHFIKEYCRLVFCEDEYEAQWNSEEYFRLMVYDEIEAGENPLGLPFWI